MIQLGRLTTSPFLSKDNAVANYAIEGDYHKDKLHKELKKVWLGELFDDGGGVDAGEQFPKWLHHLSHLRSGGVELSHRSLNPLQIIPAIR